MTMNPALPAFNHIVAFEVAKDSLVIHTLPADKQRIAANKPQAIRRELIAEQKRNAEGGLGPMLVVCEATGGYERDVLEVCVELGIPVHKAHGSRVRNFARYLGLLAKNDSIDGRVIALYGLKTPDLRLYVPLAPEVLALRDLRTRRDQVQQMLFAEKNRLEHAHHASVSRSLDAHIASLRKDLAELEAEIAAHVEAAEDLARKAQLMRTLKSVGPATVAALLAYLPELGTLSRGAAAFLVGLAPIDDDSGKHKGPRHIEAGRAAVRKTLYMTALVAMRHNPIMRLFAEKLRQRGKPGKVVITAVMRKLIVTLNAIVRSGKPWSHAQTA
jgi:transposase